MVHIDSNITDPFEIIVGTYEQYLVGYKCQNIVNEYKLEKSFATHSHLASIRSVASSKHYLASAGADDAVYLYDMRYRIESGKLMHHNDTINHITFSPEASHLFTCSNDGTIAAFRCGNWQLEKQWQKPHKGLAVHTLAIHPTGKLALSTGADGILRTWNLVKGRQAYATNLVPRLKLDAKNVTVLKWSPNGEKYLLAANQKIDIYSVEIAGVNDEVQFDSKVICVEFLKDDLIAVGLENGQVKFYDLEKSVETLDTLAHDIRVKCMAHKDDLLVTASSSGEIKLWRFTKHKMRMLQSVNCGARITCLTLTMPCKNLSLNKEVELVKEKQEKKEKAKFRLQAEVIVEHDDDNDDNNDGENDDDDDGDDTDAWEVTCIEGSDVKPTVKSKSNARSSKWIEEDTNLINKKKPKLEEDKIHSKVNQKKRTIECLDETDTLLKKKKAKEKMRNDSNTNMNSKKRKETDLISGESLKKKRKDWKKVEVNNNILKKRKVDELNNEMPRKKKKTTEINESKRMLKKKVDKATT